MILDIKELHEWRYLDKKGEQVLPWYTRSALDVLESVDMSNKMVWEYGLGLSTCWYAKNAQVVCGIDSDYNWLRDVEHTLSHYNLSHKKMLMYENVNKEFYVNCIDNVAPDSFDIIVVDGEYRNECTIKAIQKAKDGCLIILDNWLQNSVEIASQEVQDLVNKYPHTIYKQEGHPDWQTLIMIK